MTRNYTVAIVSTSINDRPAAYADWAKEGVLCVAGDKNSPPELQEYVEHYLGHTYLTPEKQESWGFSDSIGWNCVQRRNAAVMHAFQHGYDYVVTVDDDNFPRQVGWVDEHVAHIRDGVSNDVPLISDYGGRWCNIGLLSQPPVNQRGVPLGHGVYLRADYTTTSRPQCVVSTAVVLGHPDCDAVTRLVSNPIVYSLIMSGVVDVTQFAPFNSQATVWRGDWAPLMACLPGVGRYDDILASFIAKRVMMVNNVSLYAGAPVVTQTRNVHDVRSDVREEYWGMRYTSRVIDRLRKTYVAPSTPLHDQWYVAASALADLLPDETNEFIENWHATWESIAQERRVANV